MYNYICTCVHLHKCTLCIIKTMYTLHMCTLFIIKSKNKIYMCTIICVHMYVFTGVHSLLLKQCTMYIRKKLIRKQVTHKPLSFFHERLKPLVITSSFQSDPPPKLIIFVYYIIRTIEKRKLNVRHKCLIKTLVHHDYQ